MLAPLDWATGKFTRGAQRGAASVVSLGYPAAHRALHPEPRVQPRTYADAPRPALAEGRVRASDHEGGTRVR